MFFLKNFLLVLLAGFAISSFAEEAAKNIEFVHEPVTEAKAGERVRLRIRVNKADHFDIARLYFKSNITDDYNFVVADSLGSYSYIAELPAATEQISEIKYLFLFKSKAGEIIKTQVFEYKISGLSAIPASKSPIQVYSELDKAPKKIEGFDDNITIDIAESSAKFGVVAGLAELFNSGAAGATSAAGTGAGATASATTVTTVNAIQVSVATAGGLSTTAMVGIGVGGAAGVGAIASSGGSSGSGSSSTENSIEFQSGSYSGTYAWDCGGEDNGTESIVLNLSESSGSVSGSATYLLTSNSITGGSYSSSNGAISFTLPASSTTVENQFSGTYEPESGSISGETMRGDSPQGVGCGDGNSPVGTITVYFQE